MAGHALFAMAYPDQSILIPCWAQQACLGGDRRAKYHSIMTPEQQAVLRSIRKLVDFWHITPNELAMDESVHKPAQPAVPEPLLPKYRHPRTGETWDGSGSQPDWLRLALTKQGYTVEELKADSPLNRQETQ